MNINIFRANNKIKQAGFYAPFTIYFLVFAIAAAFCWNALRHGTYEKDTAFADIYTLLLNIALWFALAIVGLALATVLASWLYFFYHRRKKEINFNIQTDLKESELHEKQVVRLLINPILKPFFGFIKIRLQYDKDNFSQKFSLLENNRKKFFSTTIDGTYHWPLPQIKEYHVEKAILYFEDVFQFFSIAVNLPARSKFFTQPTTKSIKDLKVSPRKTEETNTRIEELRKVEGEYLNYKNFENNDDVRRIVWKIYAKNKELVVRIPEIMDPYASHIYLYTSFFSQYQPEGNGPIEVPFLNYYKTLTWNIYQSLVKQGFEVRYIPDQDVAKNNTADEQQWVKYSISTSKWHQSKDLKTYVKTSDASIVVISSLSNTDEVKDLIEKHGRDITFIFIKLTESLLKPNMFDWVQWLFVQNQKDDIEVYKRAWSFSPLRAKIAQNEKQLEEIIEKYQEPVVL
jgi:hypothetical protein